MLRLKMVKDIPWRALSSSPDYLKDLFFKVCDIWEKEMEHLFQIPKNFSLIPTKTRDDLLFRILKKGFANLKNSNTVNFELGKLEELFPIPLLFIAPRKQAIVIYSIYRYAIGVSNNSLNDMASYEEFASYLFKSDFTKSEFNHFYIFYYNHLKLLKLTTPIRKICGLETGKPHYKNKAVISLKLREKITPLFCAPSNFTNCVQRLMNNSGYEPALGFIYKFARVSESIGKLLRKKSSDTGIRTLIESKMEALLLWYEDHFREKELETKKLTLLAKAHMSDKNICIAGIFKKGNWGRLIHHNEKLPISVLKEKNIYFNSFDVIEISLLHRRCTVPHIEDHQINWNKPPEVIEKIPFRIREQFLIENAENSELIKEFQKGGINNVGEALQKLNRSLILIGPIKINSVLFFRSVMKGFQARIFYTIPDTSIESEISISCTDIQWRKLGQKILSKYNIQRLVLSGKELRTIFGIKKFFFVFGLGRKYRGKFWELIVGIHTIPDLLLITKKLSHYPVHKNLKKLLESKKEEFTFLYSKIPIDFGQRNLPYDLKKRIFQILENYDEDSSESLYKLINLYENVIRSFIKNRISAKTPKQWYRKHIEPLFDKTKVGRIDTKFKNDSTKKCIHIYNHPNPLIYTNLEDLSYIISCGDYRQRYFNEISDIILHFMKEIEKYRNAIFHARPIRNEEDAIFFIIKVLEAMSIQENKT